MILGYLALGWLSADFTIAWMDAHRIDLTLNTIEKYMNEKDKKIAYEKEYKKIPEYGIGPFSILCRRVRRNYIRKNLEKLATES